MSNVYFRDLNRCSPLTAEDEKALYDRMVRGKETGDTRLVQAARNKLVEAHLRLVISIAKGYHSGDLDFMDLVEEGNWGLLQAAEKFEYRPGNRFAAYAVYWIRSAITHALMYRARTVRLPEYLVKLISREKRAEQRLTQELGREPLTTELAAELGLEPAHIDAIQCAARETWSLDEPQGTGDAAAPGDTTLEDIARRQAAMDLYAALKTLSGREQFIIRRRHGLGHGKPWTLEASAAQLGISRERVRQIEAAAFTKLQESAPGKRLRDYLYPAA
jgi:RNA polymerase primary sigma factor